jgi:putative endonuclease
MLKKKLGDRGERIAEKYLLKKNYTLVERNYRIFESEIDLIMYDVHRDELVFVEVKTRSKEHHYFLDEAISFSKIQKMKRGIGIFCSQKPYSEMCVRMDAILILVREKTARVQHVMHVDV